LSSFAIILVLSSCVTHALWNLLSKKSSKTTSFFLIAALGVLLFNLPGFFFLDGVRFLSLLPPKFWLLLTVSGLSMGVYFVCLGVAYRHGDVSVAYPIIRTMPIFVLLFAGILLHQVPSLPAVLGITIVVFGCFLLPIRKLRRGPGGFQLSAYFNRSSLWALGAALGSSGYTLTDDVVMDLFFAHPEISQLSGLNLAYLYQVLQYAAIVIVLLPVVLAMESPAGLRRVVKTELFPAVLVGLMIFGTYLMVLLAYAHADKVAYVAGLRQLSIVLGVFGGMLFFKERGGLLRIAAAVIIVTGLVMIGLAR